MPFWLKLLPSPLPLSAFLPPAHPDPSFGSQGEAARWQVTAGAMFPSGADADPEPALRGSPGSVRFLVHLLHVRWYDEVSSETLEQDSLVYHRQGTTVGQVQGCVAGSGTAWRALLLSALAFGEPLGVAVVCDVALLHRRMPSGQALSSSVPGAAAGAGLL